jgi:uncharacterized protein (TIGR02996 family)
MTYDDAFLQSILENPDDDGLRLIYADWLDERGDSRGEFIRVQCELARLPESDPRRSELEARERALLLASGKEWAGPLVGLTRSWTYRRGFVEGIRLGGNAFVAYTDYLFRLAPLREVRLDSVWVRALIAVPLLGRLTWLDLRSTSFSDHDAELLVGCPYLNPQITLDLRENMLTARARQLLVSTFGGRVHF